MTRRAERVSSLIRQKISVILQEQANDPRLRNFISITGVTTSDDLKQVKIYVSVMGQEADNAQDVLKGLKAATGFLRRELGKHLVLRFIPELTFELDDSIEHGARMLNLIDQALLQDGTDES